MSQLAKFLKRYAGWIALIFVLLVVQAMCDLALPDYTSNIVNVGIQQNGIESAVPQEIRASQLQKLMLLLPEQDQKTVVSSYTLYRDGTAVGNEEDILSQTWTEEDVFHLNSDADIEMLEPMLGKAIVVLSLFEGNSEQAKAMQQQFQQQLPEEMAQMPLMDLLVQMPSDQREEMVMELQEQLSQMPDSIVTQSAIQYVKTEYQALGKDIDNIQSQYILSSGLKMLGVACLAMICTIMVTLIASRISAGYSRDIRDGTFRRVMTFSNREFDHFSTASLITRCTNDVQQIQLMMVLMLRIVLYAPIIGIGALVKVWGQGGSMTWVIGLAVVLIFGIVMALFMIAMPKFKLVQKLVDRVNLIAREILTGLPVIRAFSTQKYEEKRFDGANVDLTKTNLFVNRVMTCMMPTMMFIMNGITVLIVWVGADQVNVGNMQVGDLMAFIQYTMQIIMAFLMISMMSILMPRAWVSVRRIGEIFDESVSIHDPQHETEFNPNKEGWVEFDHVFFRYPNAEEDVLSDIHFTAKPGQTVAFIGSTGSGKSTLVNLIPRFFDVTQGEIRVNGTDVRKVSLHKLREQLGYVPQKGVLFSGTIASNICYGNEKASLEEMEEAARISQSMEFIQEKPERYDSEIAQGGTNVSGGQKQRLSIARAIAKHPKIYIFDDSFSALDFKTDVTLRKALREATQTSTILIVAQRISTVLNADQIIVLDEGKVVGQGTHKQLLQSCEVYQQIALSQLSKEELDNE
jgi:ATP-binding cassette subfamily B multidrug efflux pump